MSHLTPTDIRNMNQVLDLALTFMQFTGNRNAAVELLIRGAQVLVPHLMGINDLTCAEQFYHNGEITVEEYGKIQQLVGAEVIEPYRPQSAVNPVNPVNINININLR